MKSQKFRLNEIGCFFKFVKCPVFIRKSEKLTSWAGVLGLAIFSCGIGFTLDLIQHVPFVSKLIGSKNHLQDVWILNLGFLYAVVIVCILIPISEEYLFRFYLNKLFGNLVFFFINLFIILCLYFEFSKSQIATYIILCLGILFLCSVRMAKKFLFRKRMLFFFQRYYFIFYYFSAMTFGLSHLSNYQLSNDKSMLHMILILPQLFAGLVLGYARLKWGILSSILIHAFNNIVATMLFFLTQ